MCVTAHFINKDWILHKRIITFVKIVSHKGVDIGEAIVTAMKDWGLQRLLCCTLDNATANDGAVKHVKHYLDGIRSTVLDGSYLHMRCAAHILNLVVKDGLLEIGISVHRVREAVKWIKASPARASKFYDYAKLVKIESKKQLCLDVPTRWNSTYLMLESAEPYEQVFEVCGSMFSSYTEDLRNKKYDNGQHIGAPEAVDWVNIRKIIEYLKKFYDLTLLASGTAYATSHLFFVEMCDIFDLIAELELNEDEEVSLMATNMRKKIGKYWLEGVESNPNMNRLLYIAAVLDPRQKLKLVEKCFKSVYGLERAAVLVSEVTSTLKELFEFYKVSHHVAPTSRPRVSASTSTSIRERRSERRSAMSLEALQESDQDCDDLDTNELTIYLTEKQYKVGKNDVDQFDILMWWSSNTARYPILAEMAKDILAVPISSVASECAFSMGGRVLSPYRSSLAPEMVEALICAEDWLRSTNIDKKDEEGVPEEEQQKEFEMVLHSYTHGDPRTAQSQTDQSGSRATETD